MNTGVRSTGAYWGGGGEQIDLLTGNLNFTQPLLKAQTAGGGAGFALSYNSQTWKQAGAISSKQAVVDVGYGFGWTFQAGSVYRGDTCLSSAMPRARNIS